jgi:hypothetical protein
MVVPCHGSPLEPLFIACARNSVTHICNLKGKPLSKKGEEDCLRRLVFLLPTTSCYSSDTKCPPKVHLLKGLVSNIVLLGGGGTFKRWGLAGGLQITGCVPLKGTVGPQPFFSLSHTSWPQGKQLCFTMRFHHDVLPQQSPRHWGPPITD